MSLHIHALEICLTHTSLADTSFRSTQRKPQACKFTLVVVHAMNVADIHTRR